MEKEKGGISVSTENIFPVIKRWLYSDKDIFLREVVSNACDAITKYKRLVSLGNIESDGSEPLVSVTVDKDTRTITISDNGIGMNADEVKNILTRSRFRVRLNSLTNTKVRKAIPAVLSVTSVSASIPCLWFLTVLKSSQNHMTEAVQFTGPALPRDSSRWRTAAVKEGEPTSFCILPMMR